MIIGYYKLYKFATINYTNLQIYPDFQATFFNSSSVTRLYRLKVLMVVWPESAMMVK